MSFSIIPPEISTSPYKSLSINPSNPFFTSKPNNSNGIPLPKEKEPEFDDFEILDPTYAYSQPGPSTRPTSGSSEWISNKNHQNSSGLSNPFTGKPNPFSSAASNGFNQESHESSKDDNEIIKRSKESIRSYQCRYKIKNGNGNNIIICNALLASYDLLNKHISMHVQDTYPIMHGYHEDDNFFSNHNQQKYTCQWGNCKHDDVSIQKLRQHIEFDHLEPELRCPFKGCNDKMFKPGYGITNLSIHTQDTRKHPLPWLEESFRTKLLCKLRPIKPPLIDQNLTLPAYMMSTPPIIPKGKLPIPISPTLSVSFITPITSIPRHIREEQQSPPSSSSSYSRSNSPPTFRGMEEKIVPNRDEDAVPFFPTCGDAISYDSTGTFSGSIFPSTVPHEDGDDGREKDKSGQLIIPSTSEDGYRPMTIRKRPLVNGKTILGRPRLGTPADIFEYKRKQIELFDKENNKKLKLTIPKISIKGKEKAINDKGDGVIDDKNVFRSIHPDKIRSSALRYATRRTKRSIGVETWKEVIRFENEGRYWGELGEG